MNIVKYFLVAIGLLLWVAEPSKAADLPIVKIGITLPLTGDLGHVGEDIRRGMTLALEEIGASPVQIETIFEDNRHEPKLAVSTAQKLLNVDKIDILVSLWDMADVVAPLSQARKIPHLSIRWNPEVAHTHSYSVTFESTYLTYAESQFELFKALNVKTLALITQETKGWRLAADAVADNVDDHGLQLLSHESFIAQTPDFRGTVTKMLATKPDLVVINAYQPYLDQILKRVNEQRPGQLITGYFEAIQPASLVEGLPFVAQYRPEAWFAERFSKRYGESFKVRAPHGYDLVNIIAGVYSKAGKKVSAEEFLKDVSELKDFKGATGLLSANGSRNIENQCVWQIVKDGNFVDLSPELLSKLKIVR